MLLGLIGPPFSGKTTVYRMLLGGNLPQKGDIGVVSIPDERLIMLAEIFHPKKVVQATLEVRDCPSTQSWNGEGGSRQIAELRNLDALGIVLGGINPAEPDKLEVDLKNIVDELRLQDEIILEGREERLGKEFARAKPELKSALEQELHIVKKIRLAIHIHDSECFNELSQSDLERIKGYALFVQKPTIAIINMADSCITDKGAFQSRLQLTLPAIPILFLDAQLEVEISSLSPQEQQEMHQAYSITKPGNYRLTEEVMQICRRIHFFTVGSDEVRAWEVSDGSTAQKAAGVIHSDLERGFIRAEICPWEVLVQYKGWAGAKAVAMARTEGRDYLIKDGDVMLVHHSG